MALVKGRRLAPRSLSTRRTSRGTVGAVVRNKLAVADQHREHLADALAKQSAQLTLPLRVLRTAKQMMSARGLLQPIEDEGLYQ